MAMIPKELPPEMEKLLYDAVKSLSAQHILSWFGQDILKACRPVRFSRGNPNLVEPVSSIKFEVKKS